MTDRYALTVRLESYEYEGEFYFVGEGYATPSDVLQHVGREHILRIERTAHIEEYLLDVLSKGENVSQPKYEEVDADVDCSVYADVYYHRYSFWTGERVVEIGRGPTESEITSIVEDIRS